MKNLIQKTQAILLIGLVLLNGSPIIAYAQYDDGFFSSPSYNDGFISSPSYDDGYVGFSPSPYDYNDSYISSPSYNDGYISSPVYNDGYISSPNYNDGYISSPSYNDGYISSPAYNDGYISSPTYNDGYISSPVYNDGYVSSPSYNDGYVGSYPAYDYTLYTPSISTSVWTSPSTYSYPSYNFPTYNYPTQVVPSPVVYTPTVPTSPATVCPSGYTVNGYNCVRSCGNGVTVIYPNTCPTTPSCPTGQVLIGSTCMKQCLDNTYVNAADVCKKWCPPLNAYIPETQSCVAPTPQPNCPTGQILVGGMCMKQCPNGTYVYPGALCLISCGNGVTVPEGNVCPSHNQTCWNGQVIPSWQQCPSQYRQCPNGNTVPIGQSCTRTCFDGTIVPEGATCYRICPNGVSLPQEAACPIIESLPWVDLRSDKSAVNFGGSTALSWTSGNVVSCVASNGWFGGKTLSGSELRSNLSNTITYTLTCVNARGLSATDSVTIVVGAPQVTVNSVVTSIPTQIGMTSARCNGIGLIANNLPSNAWFEYGTSRDLGKSTATAYIGTAATSPFTNLLTGLSANTTYYCRAVMSNSLGTVKGDIVSFTTKKVETKYVAPKPTAKPPKKTETTKKEIICSDGSVISLPTTGGASQASDMLARGEKLMTLSLTKSLGELVNGKDVEYTLAYANISDANLNDVLLKVTLPADLSLVKANIGSYDPTNRILSVPLPIVGPSQKGSIVITAKVSDNASIGKSIVTQGYSAYTVSTLDASGRVVKDEVMTYLVGTIMPNSGDDANGTTTDSSSRNGFLPDTLIEWIALFTIFLILMILGRSVHESYKAKKEIG